MPSLQTTATLLSSLILRIAAYIFLRWLPGHLFIPIIFSSFAIYFISFAIKILTSSPFKVIADEIGIFARPAGIRTVTTLDASTPVVADEIVEEIDVQETVVLEEKPPRRLTTLLTGLPSPSSLPWSAVTFLINLALVAMVADLTFRSALFWPAHDLSFARVGHISETSARLLVREPDVSQLPIYLSYRYADPPEGRRVFDNAWKHAQTVNWLSKDTDFTAQLLVESLEPDTRYQYALSNNHSGHFITAPPIGQVSQREELGGKFTFLHTSCMKARVPYELGQHPLGIQGFRHLASWLGRLKPAFLLFLGDFIYIDVPRRHGTDVETYRREYRQVYASPDWPSVSSTTDSSPPGTDYDVPWLHVYDDHEIANDWSGNTTTIFPAAFDPYLHYHLAPNPPLFLSTSVTPKDLALDGTLPTWSTFMHGPAAFFILDTRRFRIISNRANPSDPSVSMLGTLQLVSLLTWLAAPPAPGVSWKFVVSSVPFTKNWRGPSTEDTWAGYLHERSVILEAMWKAVAQQSVGIVVVSGDRHEFAATAFPPPEGSEWGPEATVHEFSCSPLSMFYLPVRTYRQEDGEDVAIKYIPDGLTKFGAISVAAPMLSGQSVLTYRLFVDGKETWSHVLTAGGKIDGKSRRRGGGRGGGSGGSGGRDALAAIVNERYTPGLLGLVKAVGDRVRELFGLVDDDADVDVGGVGGGSGAVDSKEQEGKEQEGKEQEGKEQEGKEQEGKEQEGKEQEGKEQEQKEQEGKEQEGKGYMAGGVEEDAPNGERKEPKEFWVGKSGRWTERWGLDP